ncbi:hypothetical protein P2W68_21495 [Chryseobacterium arthrosphaerae]|uniref:hypothetical protein n=1 Tax=Chryseobacterium arthrosphaerae TaxID=651561 RepID=UPI0023E21ACE|nr:hypothetical protein [Chryseobacterium arthrosphaerae]WES97374.1 hypothetical protein P2W68_21495 [Chryseobacterium arthrosphaerae]
MIRDFFNYHYYRVAKFYYKRDGADATTALISVSAVQGWIIINILLIIREIFFNNEKLKYGWVVFLVVMVGILFYNKKKYKNKYLELRSKWINEEKKDKIFNGILVILTIIFSWSLIFINLLILKKIY